MRRYPSEKMEKSRIDVVKSRCKTKTYDAYDLMEKAMNKNENLRASCSFGSCGVVVLHMALKVASSGSVSDPTCHPRPLSWGNTSINDFSRKFMSEAEKAVEEPCCEVIRGCADVRFASPSRSKVGAARYGFSDNVIRAVAVLAYRRNQPDVVCC